VGGARRVARRPSCEVGDEFTLKRFKDEHERNAALFTSRTDR